MLPWYFFALITMVLAGLAAVVTKKTLFREHAMEFAVTLAIINMLFLSPFLFRINYSIISLKAWLLILTVAIFASVAFLLVVKSVRHMPISISSPLMALGPALTALLALFFLHETLSIQNSLGLLLIILGVILLEHKKKNRLKKDLLDIIKDKYFWFIIVALMLYAIVSVCDRYLLSVIKIDIIAYQSIAHVMIAIIMSLMLLYFHSLSDIKNSLQKAWKPILAISLLTLGYRVSAAYALAFDEGKAALVGAIKRGSALLSMVVGGKLFHEDNLFQKFIAAIIMIIGIILIII